MIQNLFHIFLRAQVIITLIYFFLSFMSLKIKVFLFILFSLKWILIYLLKIHMKVYFEASQAFSPKKLLVRYHFRASKKVLFCEQ